jgi:hypothetical protein
VPNLLTFDDAVAAYNKLRADALICKQLFIDVGFPVPPRVQALLDDQVERQIQKFHPSPTRVPPSPKAKPEAVTTTRSYTRRDTQKRELALPSRPDYGPPPLGGSEEWVAMKAIGASPHALTVAILKAYEPIERPKLSSMVAQLRGLKASNAGYNALTHLADKGLAKETEKGWVLIDHTIGGLLNGDILWSPEDQLTFADRASHRREGIILLLELNGGLQSYEISDGLERCGWIRAGKNRNFVKADMRQLEIEDKVKRLEDKTWVLEEVKK